MRFLRKAPLCVVLWLAAVLTARALDFSVPYIRDGLWDDINGLGARVGVLEVRGAEGNGIDGTADHYQNGIRLPATSPYAGIFGFQDVQDFTGQNDPTDSNGHGTMVAGIMASTYNFVDDQGNVTTPFSGVSWASRFYGAVFDGSGSKQAFLSLNNALNYLTAPVSSGGAGVNVINCSWGSDTTDMTQADLNGYSANALLIDEYVGYSGKTGGTTGQYLDKLIVVAAGNSGQTNGLLGSPADAYNVLVVGALDAVDPTATGIFDPNRAPTGRVASYSSWKPLADGRAGVDVVAPGTNIWSTLALNALDESGNPVGNDTIGCSSGTSFAAPHVTGAAALLYSLASGSYVTGSDSTGYTLHSDWNMLSAKGTYLSTDHKLIKALIINSADKIPGLDANGNAQSTWQPGQVVTTNGVPNAVVPLNYAVGAGSANAMEAVLTYAENGNRFWDLNQMRITGENQYYYFGAGKFVPNDPTQVFLVGLTATLVWDRHVDFTVDTDPESLLAQSATATSDMAALSNLDLILQEEIDGVWTTIYMSAGTLDNLEHIYLPLLTGTNPFRLEVRAESLVDTEEGETYALVVSYTTSATEAVPEPGLCALVILGGIVIAIGVRRAARARAGAALPAIAIFAACTASGFAGIVPNSGFEEGFNGWRPLWLRHAGAGTAVLDARTAHTGSNSVRIEHHGKEDWSFEPDIRVASSPGEFYELNAWVKLDGPGGGEVILSIFTKDAAGRMRDWNYAPCRPKAGGGWQRLSTRFIVPEEIAQIQPRLVGSGPCALWLDDFMLEKKDMAAVRAEGLPPQLTVRNAALAATFDTATATLAVEDLRNGRRYRQKTMLPETVVTAARAESGRIVCTLLHVPSNLPVRVSIALDGDLPECVVECDAKGALSSPVHFPAPFLTEPGDSLVIPMNEGISYPVEDKSIEPMHLAAYGGHGICMAFWGQTDGERGQMAIFETPDDAAIRIDRAGGRLSVAPEWEAQRGQFGYARRLRYAFFDKGGHVAFAKRYRAHARKTGLFKTLAEKRRENPNVDRLVGAVNVWCWEQDGPAFVREMQAAGISRILWSNEQSPQNLKTLNDLGVLSSRYDIYQDVMNPATIPLLNENSPLWPHEAWPNDVIVDAQGNWVPGWNIEGKDGKWYPCGAMCDLRAPAYARQRIPPELATHPYLCRFIDTTTATPWRECYDPHHPMTRTESKRAKMALLQYVSRDCKLVTGCETGHDASVPFLHYFEGMLSLAPYRVPDSGRAMDRIWNEVPAPVAKFQVGHQYRLPLWELVYHECVVAQWYWGDYNNKLPALWDKRDLFNVLYGTPPMFMFDRKLWAENKARFVQSYKATAPYVRAAGYSEMTDHRFLTPDRAVQQTAFANGMTVTVNFGTMPFALPGGGEIAPMGYVVTGMPEEAKQ